MMDESDLAAIGQRIRDAREKAKLSRPELAELMKLHPSSISNYESGRVPWKDLPRLAECINSDLRWLLFGTVYQDPLDQINQRLTQIEKMLEGALPDRQSIADEMERELEEHVQRARERGVVGAKAGRGPRRKAQAS